PHDVLTLIDGRKITAAPIPYYIGPGATFSGSVELKTFDHTGKIVNQVTVARREIQSVTYYEQAAIAAVNQFLQAAGPKKTLTPVERLEAAEKVLAAVLRFHRPAPDRRARQGEWWKDQETRLQERLLAVRLDRLHELVFAENWDEAFAWGDRLIAIYTESKVRQQIAQELAKLVELPLKSERYEEVQKRLMLLERFPQSATATEQIGSKLRKQAAELFKQAQEAKEKNHPEKANELATKAERLWPRLAGLRDFRWRLNRDHPTLGVGVRELPEFFSPPTAVLDSEKMAVELLFESLVKAHDGPGGQTYEPMLAAARPRLTPRGWEFHLDRDAYWPNGERVTAVDVRDTVQMLSKPGWPGFPPELAGFVEPPLLGREWSVVTLSLRQGFLDPLSLMTFKILPAWANLDSPANVSFARRPVGSGPFQLADEQRLRDEQKAG